MEALPTAPKVVSAPAPRVAAVAPVSVTPFATEPQSPVAGSHVRSLSPSQDPRAINGLLTQANLSRVRGNWSEAIDRCVEVLQADPANAAAHALLGDIYAARGRREDAVQWYRMALEIHPNPIDEAKLNRIEREIVQAGAQQARKGQRIAIASNNTPSADGQAPVGTVALMGVSPRLWLRGITAASLAFLLVSGAILLGTQNRHAKDGSIPHPLGEPGQSSSITPLQGSDGGLPPARLGGPSVVPPGSGNNAVEPPHVGGSGLAPDSTSSARTLPAAFPDTRQAGATTPAGLASRSNPNLPTAPVQGIRPLSPSGGTQGFATLSGGMKLAKMSSLTSSDEAVLVLANSPSSSNQENFRQNAIRNVYRAARNAFATNGEAKEASVYIQTDLTEKGGAVLVVAHVDRDNALKSDPDSELPESLLNRLSSIQWNP